MNVICLEDDAFHALIDKLINRIKEMGAIKEDKWISGEEAMKSFALQAKPLAEVS